jgi:hypothetical protein
MREQMTVMRSMGSSMMSDDPKTGQKTMAECMDMMQMMMEQMMQHQEAMQPMPKYAVFFCRCKASVCYILIRSTSSSVISSPVWS